MTEEKSPPRLSIKITEEQAQALNEMLDWGEQVRLFNAVVDNLIALYLKKGKAVIYALMSGQIDLLDVAKTVEKMKGENND